MQITIKLFATLREGRFEEKNLDFPSGTTVGGVVRQMDLPEKEVTLVFINGRHADLTTILSDGDALALFPPVGGG
ncbi:MAG: ThiS family protein [Syntrophus sp. PtaU1.Bin208]|nr:MAG: ThiS family protein [Syntrophus sp. PtaU1.Bin208]